MFHFPLPYISESAYNSGTWHMPKRAKKKNDYSILVYIYRNSKITIFYVNVSTRP